MPTNKHTATAPDGAVLKRNSKTRTYTHCVAGRRTEDQLRRAAEYNVDYWTRGLESYQRQLRGEEELGRWESTDTLAHNASRAQRELEKAQRELDAIDGDQWRALSWCSRPDLVPARVEEFNRRHVWVEVIAIPAEVRS